MISSDLAINNNKYHPPVSDVTRTFLPYWLNPVDLLDFEDLIVLTYTNSC